MATQIDDLWAQLHKLSPASRLGGIYANKRGYHNKRRNLPSSDYSVSQFHVDKLGPSTEAAAIDWTFPNAQGGNYSTIAKYSKRLMAAGKAKDPRTIYMREFFGNTDDDRHVEGYDFTKERLSSSDSSHLWHIHISIHRKYINDPEMVRAIISILKGESIAAWKAKIGSPAGVNTKPAVAVPSKPSTKVAPWPFGPKDFYAPFLTAAQAKSIGQKVYNPGKPEYRAGVKAVQHKLGLKADGLFGPATCKEIRQFQKVDPTLDVDGLIGPSTWKRIFS